MANIEDVKIGPCSVTFDGTDLGYTKGGVTATVATDTYEVTVDQGGTSVKKEKIIGRSITAEVPMVETSIEKAMLIMPGATLVTDSSDANKKRMDVSVGIGVDLVDLAKSLVLHPTEAGSDVSLDVIIPKAATAGAMELVYSNDAERVYNTTWKGYADANNLLFQIGDLTATAA